MDEQRLVKAIAYRERGRFESAGEILWDLYAAEPDHPRINYQLAWLHDAQNKEREAVPFYEKAIAEGLSGAELRGAMLGLGSTYRCLGRYDQAIATLRQAIVLFPDAHEFVVFLAMALYNVGQHAEAMGMLLRALVETTQNDDLVSYRNAIMFYHDKLDQVWE